MRRGRRLKFSLLDFIYISHASIIPIDPGGTFAGRGSLDRMTWSCIFITATSSCSWLNFAASTRISPAFGSSELLPDINPLIPAPIPLPLCTLAGFWGETPRAAASFQTASSA